MHAIKFKNTGSIFYKVNVKNVHIGSLCPGPLQDNTTYYTV